MKWVCPTDPRLAVEACSWTRWRSLVPCPLCCGFTRLRVANARAAQRREQRAA